MDNENKCYFCSAPAVSREHIPPQGLFPSGAIFREELITVPSCKKHNENKSDLDHRMLTFLVGTSSVVSDEDFQGVVGRVSRGVVRNTKTLTTMSKGIHFYKDTNTLYIENIHDTEAVIDYHDHRFYQECILRGLYYNEYSEIWGKDLFIIPTSLFGFGDSFKLLSYSLGLDILESEIKKDLKTSSKNKVFQYKSYKTELVTIIGVCIYMKYYFYGIFSTLDILDKIKGKFTPDNPVIKFNQQKYL
ncbi:hypothetical protein HV032_11145 [Citrobacter freundii]|nr:hypothetical protein [Citrobacter freundii]QMA42030.1 hypothetical protein HV032_11145 [Citrobacter freundii]